MRAIQILEHGGPQVLKAAELPRPSVGAGHVLVKNAAAGVNFIDTHHRTGLYPVPLPSVLGVEGAGVVEAVGADITHLTQGDRVAYINFATRGSYAEFTSVPVGKIAKLPDSVSFEMGAAAMVQGMTASSFVTLAYRVQPGDFILVHAAAGGTGRLLSQIGKLKGAIVIGTTSTPEKAEVARKAGCDHAILYTQSDIVEEVRRITGGRGVAAVYDGVGKDTFDSSMDSLARFGTLVSFGNTTGKVPPVDLLRLSKGNYKLMRPTIYNYADSPEELEQLASETLGMVASGQLDIPYRVYPLEQAAQAHADLEGGGTTGKLLLRI